MDKKFGKRGALFRVTGMFIFDNEYIEKFHLLEKEAEWDETFYEVVAWNVPGVGVFFNSCRRAKDMVLFMKGSDTDRNTVYSTEKYEGERAASIFDECIEMIKKDMDADIECENTAYESEITRTKEEAAIRDDNHKTRLSFFIYRTEKLIDFLKDARAAGALHYGKYMIIDFG